MQVCSFCSRWFRNRQAVRAHLKYCEHYERGETPVRDEPVANANAKASPRRTLCQKCGSYDPREICATHGKGPRIFEDLAPMECFKCGELSATESVHWKGYCLNEDCGWPLSDEAQAFELARRKQSTTSY